MFALATKAEEQKKEEGEEQVAKEEKKHLENEEQFYAILEHLGFVSWDVETDKKAATDLLIVLDYKLSKRNVLVLLAQVEKVSAAWMVPVKEEGKEGEWVASTSGLGVFNFKDEFYVSEEDGKKLRKKFEAMRLRRVRVLEEARKGKLDQYD